MMGKARRDQEAAARISVLNEQFANLVERGIIEPHQRFLSYEYVGGALD